MTIQMRCDGKVFSGTPREIVEGMKKIAFIKPMSLDEYITFVEKEARRIEDKILDVNGNTTEERAESLVRALVREHLADFEN